MKYNYYSARKILACIASVSVWFWNKEIPRNEIFGFDHAKNESRTSPHTHTHSLRLSFLILCNKKAQKYLPCRLGRFQDIGAAHTCTVKPVLSGHPRGML